MLPPIPRGALGSMIPRPQHCYLQFGDPLDLSEEKGKKVGKKKLQAIRDQVAAQIEEMLAGLLVLRAREQHKDGFLLSGSSIQLLDEKGTFTTLFNNPGYAHGVTMEGSWRSSSKRSRRIEPIGKGLRSRRVGGGIHH